MVDANGGNSGGDQALIVGIGMDLIAVERIRRVLRRRGERFMDCVLTIDERAYCLAHRDPAERVAARWAAKEAALKALGTGRSHGLDYPNIEVIHSTTGQPLLRFHHAAHQRCTALGIIASHISLTHADGMAAAVVILER